eukprot:scaffold94734_cov45-Phaeocystis_antarctica.AAC.3
MSATTQVGQSATTAPRSGSVEAGDVQVGLVNAEHLPGRGYTQATRRATLPAEGDTWQPGDSYQGKANLEAKLDAAFSNESEPTILPASCATRRGNVDCPGGSRASLVAANAPKVGTYSPPDLRSSLHRRVREDSGAPGTASAHVHQEGLSGKGCHWETITTSVRDAAAG